MNLKKFCIFRIIVIIFYIDCNVIIKKYKKQNKENKQRMMDNLDESMLINVKTIK